MASWLSFRMFGDARRPRASFNTFRPNRMMLPTPWRWQRPYLTRMERSVCGAVRTWAATQMLAAMRAPAAPGLVLPGGYGEQLPQRWTYLGGALRAVVQTSRGLRRLRKTP